VIERREVLVDTGAWLAISITGDEHHHAASDAFRQFLSESRALITTNLIISESYTLIQRTGGHARATAFLQSLHTTSRVRTVYSDQALERHAAQILAQYTDQRFSYVDAVNFALMRERGITHAFAFDRHFLTAGLVIIPPT
jgi:uncharacterized protein